MEQVANEGEPALREIYGRKALWWAAFNGYESVVRQLLEIGLSGATIFGVKLRGTGQLVRYHVLADPENLDGQVWYEGWIIRSWKESKPIVDLLVAYGAKIGRDTKKPAS